MKPLTSKILQAGLYLSLSLSGSQAASGAEVMKRGKELYEGAGSCVTCHMADGKGQPGSIPPLAGSTWLQDPNRTIAIALRGLVGPIKVDKRRYYSAMPPQLLFDDEKLAAIITYINQMWGNKVSAVTAEQVGKARATLPPDIFTPERVMKEHPFAKSERKRLKLRPISKHTRPCNTTTPQQSKRQPSHATNG